MKVVLPSEGLNALGLSDSLGIPRAERPGKCGHLSRGGDGPPNFSTEQRASFRQNSPEGGGILPMKKSRFSVEKIVVILKQAEQGMPVAELIRKVFPRTNL